MSNVHHEGALAGPGAVAGEGLSASPCVWRRRLLTVLKPVFAMGGLGMLGALVHKAGAGELKTTLLEALPLLPWVVLIELGRQTCDATATRLSYGARARQVPLSVLVRAQLIGTAVSSMAPAGRAAAEATKATLLTPYTGGASATAAAATSQSASLGAGGLISFPCALAAYLMTGWSAFTVAMLVHGVVLLLASLGVRAGLRAKRLGAWMRRRCGKWGEHAEAFQASVRAGGLCPWRPMMAFLGSRVLQVMQYAVLAHAVGIDSTVVQALFTQGLYLVALAMGSLVPGQVGVTDGMFSLAAGAMGTTAAKAMSIALLAHTVQAVFVLVGALTPLVWRAKAKVTAAAPVVPPVLPAPVYR
ncbi:MULTISPECIES: lysylphosphatidylglycerol synthase domain-containing protein [unclassified Corallococcus]|uniref:lysylphosphatidylglycerol synthase domain-containing protein n=1 Tax=unclassified Corallococcus TaxID=2685029 RepID=UPI001A8D2C84|nr:lysylphosphatidylglycerol synthase domain-containing protein [Corallococcus sp. NCRR]MBN9688482.1 flippase-like domain-containing protein [Corallococcus sp. NCSPR001]WAS87716.1 lysylphosphatidylglycerol synthase domain-containing protein [Corallococcus sp. NCRR]